ncbi:hypothetical protein [Saccharopolyspora sp. ASAGF58]|uniref:hypothetical protein n=1 Tax=Saccharopolyspora sp. ASAGF58 TaxID=2719023 RepID=UPI001446638C|nr:hypothetical protein [Saccharopolyspora sp. ASAGF58]
MHRSFVQAQLIGGGGVELGDALPGGIGLGVALGVLGQHCLRPVSTSTTSTTNPTRPASRVEAAAASVRTGVE